jgi:hypothetical protein
LEFGTTCNQDVPRSIGHTCNLDITPASRLCKHIQWRQVQCKVRRTQRDGRKGAYGYSSTLSVIAVLVEQGRSTPRSGHFKFREIAGLASEQVFTGAENLSSGFYPQIVQFVSIRYTASTNTANKGDRYLKECHQMGELCTKRY